MNTKIYSAMVGILAVIFLVAGALGAAAGSAVYEAETMTVTGATNWAVTDGWALMGEAEFSQLITFATNNVNFKIIARGDYAGGAWPIMEIKIDGILIQSITVDSVSWKTFEFDVETTPGAHTLTFTFINDFYEGTSETDRNLYVDKVTVTEAAVDKWVTVAWDANTEPDLVGYKVYYGKTSRKTADPAAMQAWCVKNEPENANCLEEWQAICKDPADQACYWSLFKYDQVVDVKNVTEYKITGLISDQVYYLAATAYDDKQQSLFSAELKHSTFAGPQSPQKIISIPMIIQGKGK